MGFLDKLKALFSGGPRSSESQTHTVYLRCNTCGEPLALRVDLRNDLSPEWHSTSAGGSDYPDYYSSHKTVIGSRRCYVPIEVDLTFDKQKRPESQQAQGGTIISEEEYRQTLAEWEARESADEQ
ncbi:MAG: hypothetical protein HPY83_12450 [Anaerolineae bacterium]|nr:hypothetical protein [Anaerolineae bacterium]